MPSSTFDLDEIPQANDLAKVGHTVLAVSKGNSTYQLIAKAVGFVERQARYYRRAAEILGLIEQQGRNNSVLTASGKLFVQSFRKQKDIIEAIKPSLLSIPLLREVYERVSQSKAVDEDDILECLINLSGVKKSNRTIVRRLSTFVSWLKQAGLLEEIDEGKAFKLLPIFIKAQASLKIAPDEDKFLTTITSYLHVPKIEENISWEKLLTDYLELRTIKEKETWLFKEPIRQRFARYMIGISSKETINVHDLDIQIKDFRKIDMTHARLLIERDRSLRFVSKSIRSGGEELEERIQSWLTNNSLDFKRAHLLPGSQKNVDFFIESLNLAVESKFSKTTGTKHSGAIYDLTEIAKAKANIKGLLVGVALAGEGFEDSFFDSLETLYKKEILDFILSSKDIGNISPKGVTRLKRFRRPDPSELVMKSNIGMSWSEPLTDNDQGLYDAAYWLKKYSAVSYISFQSRLQTWINQTPFAIECLRLILGWSDTQMYNFILNAVPNGVASFRRGEINPDHVSLLVAGMSSTIAEEELSEIASYFDTTPTVDDFVAARIEAFDGIARKKKNTSKIFIEMCKEATTFKIVDKMTDLTLNDSTNIQSNFSIIDEKGIEKHVICKYYSGDGSVMSDLVKRLEALSSSPNADHWIVIIDGGGWKKRSKDLRRLLAIAKDTQFQLFNFNLWKSFRKTA